MFRRTATSLMRRSVVALNAADVIHQPLTCLTNEETMLLDSVRTFCLQSVAPRSQKMDETGVMDPGMLKEAFEAGMMGIEIPSELDGGGMSFFSTILAVEEMARHDPSFAVCVDVHSTLVSNVFLRYGNESQQKAYLPKLATQTTGSFCLTESGSGSDAFALKTKAERQGDKWVINGTKMFITNGGDSSIFLIFANTDFSKGYKGITCFAVDTSEVPGVKVVRTEKKLGIRASSTCEINFDNVTVTDANVVGEIGEGYKIAIRILNEGRIGISAQMLGIAQGALDIVIPYIFQRKQFGKAIGEFQAMQMQYAECFTELHAARLLTYNAARKKMNGEDFLQDAAMAKYFSAGVAEKTASRAIEWAGGIGFMRDFGLERFYRDAKIGSIYEGTSIIQLQTIAKAIKKVYEM